MSVLSDHASTDPQPGASDTTLSDPRVFAQAVPHQEFARRRRDAPVAWVDEIPLVRQGLRGACEVRGSGYWAVTRYATLHAASRQPDLFSCSARGAFLSDPKSARDLERMRQLLISMDDPQHAHLRKIVSIAFTPSAVARIADSVRTHARATVAHAHAEREFDAVHALAAELPVLVLAELFGMPAADRHLLFRWSNQLVGFDDPEYGGGDVKTFQRTFVEAFAYVADLAEQKRGGDADDLVSRLVNARIDGRSLSMSELCHFWILLVVAGNETTRHLISGSLQLLHEWPDERARLQRDPNLVPHAVEELLRFWTPIMQFRRTATRDTELDGQPIRSGDKVVLYYISGNRDAAAFEAADRLDLGRHPNPHLAFGSGPHFCLGARLARLETAFLLQELRPYLHNFELTGPVVRLQSNFVNGIKSMPARFAPARSTR
jgi:cytochrome P450